MGIPRLAGRERRDPLVVQADRGGRGQPAVRGAPQRAQFPSRPLTEGGRDERALAGSPIDEILGFEFPAGLDTVFELMANEARTSLALGS
jgi:hypothetical protein